MYYKRYLTQCHRTIDVEIGLLTSAVWSMLLCSLTESGYGRIWTDREGPDKMTICTGQYGPFRVLEYWHKGTFMMLHQVYSVSYSRIQIPFICDSSILLYSSNNTFWFEHFLQEDYMCTQWRLRSAIPSAVWSEYWQGFLWVAKDPEHLQMHSIDSDQLDAQTDLSLPWLTCKHVFIENYRYQYFFINPL